MMEEMKINPKQNLLFLPLLHESMKTSNSWSTNYDYFLPMQHKAIHVKHCRV